MTAVTVDLDVARIVFDVAVGLAAAGSGWLDESEVAGLRAFAVVGGRRGPGGGDPGR